MAIQPDPEIQEAFVTYKHLSSGVLCKDTSVYVLLAAEDVDIGDYTLSVICFVVVSGH